MKLTLLPLQKDEVIRIACEGHLTLLPVQEPDPIRVLLGPHCHTLRVLLNMDKVQSIDTSGISWLFAECDAFQKAGGKIVYYMVPPVVTLMLGFLRLAPLIPIAPDETAARAMAVGSPDPHSSNDKPNHRPVDPLLGSSRMPG